MTVVSPAPPSSITARLVLHAENRGWILEKFAERLVTNLASCGVTAEISDRPDPNAAINHWMVYTNGPDARVGASTMLVTHADRIRQMRLLIDKLRHVDVGVCLSSDMVRQLRELDVPASKLAYVVPGTDMAGPRRRTVIAIQSRVYQDGRKREDLLVRLAQTMRLDWFHFDIAGAGWEAVIASLRGAGATVDYSPGDGDFVQEYRVALERLGRADFYLYPGLDEGSMGTLDALAAGVPTIVTTQGFHLDLEHGITHGFQDFDELLAIFQQLAAEREARRAAVVAHGWDVYAKKHAAIWRAILAGSYTGEPQRVQSGKRTIARRWAELAVSEGRRRAHSLFVRARRAVGPRE